jgi:TolB-like protein
VADDLSTQPLADEVETQGSEPNHHNRKKHKAKVRAAWISFVGRIVAQIAGATATIVIGLAVLNRYAVNTSHPGGNPDGPVSAAAGPTAPQPCRADCAPGDIDLAVLPFENLSADPAQGYLADGITDTLIAHLARIEGLHVISRTSSMHYKGQRKPVPQIAAELGVDVLVEGTVTGDGARVRVTVQLVDALTDHDLWAQSYDRPHGNILALQADLSSAIAREVHATVAPGVERALASQPRIEPGVYEEYIRGRIAAKSGTADGLQAAIRHFERALQLAPAFAPAYGGLAVAHALNGLQPGQPSSPTGAFEPARTAAARALEIDPALAEAQAVLAVVAHRRDWDWGGANAAFRRSIALSPGDAQTHQWYAIFLAEQGRHREALAEAEFALELDPLLAEAHGTLGLVHYYARRFDRSASAARRALELDPSLTPPRLLLAWSLLERGEVSGAIGVCEARPWRAALDEMLATLADAHRRRGRLARADEIRRELLALDAVSPSALVRLHISRGEVDAAFSLLDRAVTERSAFVRALRVDPLFAPLRRDPRFGALAGRLEPGDGQ